MSRYLALVQPKNSYYPQRQLPRLAHVDRYVGVTLGVTMSLLYIWRHGHQTWVLFRNYEVKYVGTGRPKPLLRPHLVLIKRPRLASRAYIATTGGGVRSATHVAGFLFWLFLQPA